MRHEAVAVEAETQTEIVARLAELPPLDYDGVREKEAEALGVRVSTLDKEVAKARKESEPAEGTGAALLMDDPEHWPESVDGGVLLATLTDTVRCHVVMAPVAADAVALWVLHSHAHDSATVSPLLSITSPQKRCGKTTLLSLLQAIVRRPLPASNITAAALFRAVEKWRPTVLVDEADTFLRESDELRGVLNSGHNRAGAYVIRTVGDDHDPRAFSTWAPKAIALIGNMPGTLADRSVAVALRRKTADEKAQPLRLDRLDALAALPQQCIRWAEDNRDRLRRADPAIPQGLHDRAADNWRALFAIADVAGGDWPERARRAAVSLLDDDAAEDAAGVMLLADMQALFSRLGPKATTTSVLEELHRMDERPWPEWRQGKPITARGVARLLKPFGLQPRQLRLGERAGISGYRVGDFQDAFARYLPSSSSTPLHASTGAAPGDFHSSTPENAVEDAESRKRASRNGCRGVEDTKPGKVGEVRL